MPLPSCRLGLSSLVAVVAVAATCLVLSPAALAGDPLTSIKVNEVESDGLADFIELTNISATATDVSGLILRDSTASSLTIPAATSIPAGGFLAVDTDPPFGLGSSDQARVFMPDGTTLIDRVSWPSHAATTVGRCPDGTGAPVITGAVTKGAANSCPPPPAQPWPGSSSVTTVDQEDVLGTDLSGLDYEGSSIAGPGVLWAVNNGTSRLLRLVRDGSEWVSDTANGWSAGKELRFPTDVGLGPTSEPDSEGVTLTDAGAAGGVYVSSERALVTAPGSSRNSILRYDVSGAGATLTATREWNLTLDLPAVGNNAGAESVEWVPDSSLVASGFVDQATGLPYNPATYANHGTGLFFVGLEANGSVYAYALDQTPGGGFTRVATFVSGFATFGALHWEDATNQLWVVCDDNCDGRSHIFEVDTQPGATQGSFVRVAGYDRPTGMGNFNNEGFTITPASECIGGSKPVFWANDGYDDDHALRAGTISCSSPTAAPWAAGWSASTSVKGDFNGDGDGDLAVGVREDGGRGAVHVLPGSATGVGTAGSQFWSQNSIGIVDAGEDGDDFGRALAVGDFNGDGFADLAIGVPGENDGKGVVHVLYGSASGLTATGSQQWSQASAGVGDGSEAGDHFGATLAAGDLDGSTVAMELVVGTPDEDLGAAADAGVVQVLRGSASGLTGTGSQTWSQASTGVTDNPEAGDRFGSSLAIGDLGGSAQVDLAVGVPEEDGSVVVDHGVVQVLLGSATGVTATGSSLWSQNSAGVGDTAEVGDGFGASLAIGNVGGTAVGDLVVGVPGEDSGAIWDVGIVQTLPGAAAGPTGTGSQTFGQGTVGIADAPEAGDEFGFSVAVADFGGSAVLDLAVGAPGESGTTLHHGVVHLIPGSASGLTASGSALWSQNSAGVGDTAEANDRFGAALAASDYGDSIESDLAVGVPSESSGALSSVGIVQILPGSAAFLTGTGSKTFGQSTSGVADTAEVLDAMGIALGR